MRKWCCVFLLLFPLLGMAIDNLEEILKKAENGDMKSQFEVAKYYDTDDITQQNYEKALFWYKRAAEQGHTLAQGTLGSFYYHGIGISVDYNEALKWFLKSDNHKISQDYIGQIYWYGLGVKEDKETGLKWFIKAAENGNSETQFFLAVSYFTGNFLNIDDDKGMSWLQKAADNNNKDAEELLVRMKLKMITPDILREKYNSERTPSADDLKLKNQLIGTWVLKRYDDIPRHLAPPEAANIIYQFYNNNMLKYFFPGEENNIQYGRNNTPYKEFIPFEIINSEFYGWLGLTNSFYDSKSIRFKSKKKLVFDFKDGSFATLEKLSDDPNFILKIKLKRIPFSVK